MKKFLSLLLALSLALSLYVPVFAADGVLTDGDNTIELPWDTDEAVTYTYTATQTGTLYLSVEEFYYADGDFDYMDNSDYMNEFADYTAFTVDGQTLDGGYFGSVEVVEGQTYTILWEHLYATEKWYKLGWQIVLNISYTGDSAPQLGSEELPVELYRTDLPTESIEIPAGGSVWYVLYEFDYAEFMVTGENAYINTTVYNMDTLEQEAHHLLPVDGVVTLPVNTWRVWVEIGNSGTEPAVFQLDYRYPVGCKKNPAELVMGENTAKVKKDDYEGYMFEWVAQCDGQLKLTMPEKNWTVVVYNQTTGDDGLWLDDSTADTSITVDVKKGEQFRISIINYDEMSGMFLAAQVKFQASVVYAHEYVDGKCLHCGAEEESQGGEEEVLVGDVNGDGRINARDARVLLQLAAGLIEESTIEKAAADINGDGRVNARDARALLQKIANA